VLGKACIGVSEGTVQFGWVMCWAFNKQFEIEQQVLLIKKKEIEQQVSVF
jgi:hypothetical protein